MAGDRLGPDISKLQQLYQRPSSAHVHMLGKLDKLTSLAIPGAMSVVATIALAGGLYKLYTGTGKEDQ